MLLTIGTERDKRRTAYFILTDYVRKGSARSQNRLFIVHRLDRETSGVLIFAKSEEAKLRLQDMGRDRRRNILPLFTAAAGKGRRPSRATSPENRAHVVYSTADAAQGKLSHTAYRVRNQTKQFALLEVNLLTGRKNQIRVHLAGIGHPIVGDRKYGRPKDPTGPRLHARQSPSGTRRVASG